MGFADVKLSKLNESFSDDFLPETRFGIHADF
jgi:hypothetical protein